MNRVLFVTRHDLFKTYAGGAMASRAFLMAFNEVFDGELDVVCSAAYEMQTLHPNNRYIQAPDRSKCAQVAGMLAGRLHRYRGFVKRLIREKPYRLCILDGSIVAGDLVRAVRRRGVEVMVIHHNVESDYHMDSRSHETLGGHFPWYVIRNERNAYRYGGANLFIARHDMDIYESKYGARPGNYVLGCFDWAQAPAVVPLADLNTRDGIRLVLSGTLWSPQTQDAVLYFLSELLPLAEAVHPGIRVIVTGRNPSPLLQRACASHPCVELIPNPEDIGGVVRSANIYVCATRLGSGLKLRVMDGLRNGMPVLTHTTSAQGYESFSGYEWFREFSTHEEFVAGLTGIIQLLRQGQIVPEKVREAYDGYFSFGAGVARLRNILEQEKRRLQL